MHIKQHIKSEDRLNFKTLAKLIQQDLADYTEPLDLKNTAEDCIALLTFAVHDDKLDTDIESVGTVDLYLMFNNILDLFYTTYLKTDDTDCQRAIGKLMIDSFRTVLQYCETYSI